MDGDWSWSANLYSQGRSLGDRDTRATRGQDIILGRGKSIPGEARAQRVWGMHMRPRGQE